MNSKTGRGGRNSRHRRRNQQRMANNQQQKVEVTTQPHSASGTPMGEIDAELQSRLDALHEYLLKHQRTSAVTNPGLELGRPALNPPANMKFDKANVYRKWTIDELSALTPKHISNNMATAEDLVKVQVTLESLGVPKEHMATVMLQVAIYCKDTSASSHMDSKGTFDWKGGSILSDTVVAAMRKDTSTLRKVCRLYAPIVWNYMLTHNSPPSDWAAMGFPESDRFAAFDFFDYVENPAAIQPYEGLIRKPTSSEKIAHNTFKRLALDRAARNETYASYAAEITGGRIGPEIQRDFNLANNRLK